MNLLDHVIDDKVVSGPYASKSLMTSNIPIVPCYKMFHLAMQQSYQFVLEWLQTKQRQSLFPIGIYPKKKKKDFFSHSQLYVTMSRDGNHDKLKILRKRKTRRINSSPKTLSIHFFHENIYISFWKWHAYWA